MSSAVVLATYGLMRKGLIRNLSYACLAILIASDIFIWYAVFYFDSAGNLRINFFDVGQGDAIFIEAPDGNQILIDGGPDRTILSRLGSILPFWDRTVDLLILTHPHADHLDGLLEVLKRYEVKMVLESGILHSIPEYQEWEDLLVERKTPVIFARAGQRVKISDDFYFDVLSPFKEMRWESRKNPHDGTVVTRLVYGQNSFLFMGDAEKLVEYQLAYENLGVINSDVLKVGHHGSKTSSTEDFLDLVSPEIAIIQVGKKNRYGHPAQEVLDRLSAAGAKILRNDLEGTIKLVSDGNYIDIR